MIKSLIIEDERRSREVLLELVDLIPGLEVVGEAGDVDTGIEKIIELQPDVIFLDIEMPVKNGFDLIRELKETGENPEVIFVTAYDKYAIEAFKYAAFDYLMKPVGLTELNSSINRLRLKRKSSTFNERMARLINYLDEKEKIKFNLRTGILIIDPKDLVYCEADGNYTHLILTDGKSEVVSFNLGHVEEQLKSRGFFRVSRSVLVNLDHIIKLDTRNRFCELKYDQSYLKLKVSQAKIKELQAIL